MKLLFLLVLFVYSVNCQNVWEDIKTAVGGTACLATVSPKLISECLNAFDKELESRPKGERDNKARCCAYLQLQSCTIDIAKKDCGTNGESVAKSFLNSINRGITSDDCIDYGFITCITLTQIAVFAAIVLVFLSLLSCICCCCCR